MEREYPRFVYYPRSLPPPEWVKEVIGVFSEREAGINTEKGNWAVSDKVLAALRPGLEQMGFQVESGKKKAQKLHRPVFFGEQGRPSMTYEIDGYHPLHRILLEVEAGRSIQGNSLYRDLVQMSLMAESDYAVIAVPLEYRYRSGGKPVSLDNYELAKRILEAVWGTERLKLPFQGMLLIGY